MKKFGKGISGALLSLAFVFGVVVSTRDSAQAQGRNDDGYYQHDQRNDDRKDRKREMKRRRKNREDRRGNNQGDWRREQDRNRNNDGYDNYGRYGRNGNNGYDQAELNRGYQQGINTGASDGQRGQNYDPQRSRYFKNASSQAFREGFVRGYDQGYRQYSRNGNNRNNGDSGLGNILGGILGRP